MANRLFRLLMFCVATCLPGLASAVDFTGSYQPSMYSDANIFDGVQLANGTGTVAVTAGAGPNDLNLSLTFNSLSISLPLVTAGNVATLAGGNYTVGTTTVLDTYLLSDGNNMALAYVAQDQSSAISYVISAWQRNPSFAAASAALGHWTLGSAFANANLRDINGPGFQPKPGGSFDIVSTGNAYAMQAGSINVPISLAQGRGTLLSAPTQVGSGYWQILDMVYDNHGAGAYFFIGTELSDATDVAIDLGLIAQAVPEPETYAMLLAGLGLLGGALARRRRLDQ